MVNLIENTTNEIPADILINVNYYFIEKKYSTKTKYAYIDMMRRYCRIVTDLAEIDEKALKLVYYKISDGKSDGFKLQLRAAIKILYKEGLGLDAPINLPSIRMDVPQTEYLNEEEINQLLNYLVKRTDYYGRLYYTLTSLMYGTAARFSEVSRLKWGDMIFTGEHITDCRIIGKGGNPEKLGIHENLSNVMLQWRDYLVGSRDWEPLASAYFFPGRSENYTDYKNQKYYYSKSSITHAAFNSYLKRACCELRFGKDISTHSLRHSAATNALRKLGCLNAVSLYLRHESVTTTLRYIHMVPDGKKNIQDYLASSMRG